MRWGSSGIKRMFTLFYRKKIYEVLFPVEDIIIIFCWEAFWPAYSKDLI